MKGYGGYPILMAYGSEYYTGDTVRRFNSARYAITEAFKDGEFTCLWVPYYTCQSVVEALEKERVPYKRYNITNEFLPELQTICTDECILITNYYGILGESFYQEALRRYSNIIFDNTQSFYAQPIMQKNIYNVYSPRKFFGVCDGAYLVAESFQKKHSYPLDISSERCGFLFSATEKGTNAAYSGYLACEDDLSNSGVREMSILTRTLLSNIDYEKARKRRQENFRHVREKLSGYNELQIRDDICPMVYPLLRDTGSAAFRELLIKNRIYVSQWWKWVLSIPEANEWERKLSNYIFPIPIDPRYSTEELDEMLTIIRELLEHK